MNIVSIVTNDEHCGVVDENGQIRLLTKRINGGSFKDLLELENRSIILNKKIQGIINKKEILYKKNIVPFLLSIVFLLSLISPFIFDVSLGLMSKIALIVSFLSTMVVYVSNTLEYAKNNQLCAKLIKQKKEIDKKIRKILDKSLIVERILFSRDETVKGNESEEKLVNECADYLHRIIENNIGKIDTFYYEYYNNPYVPANKIKVLLPVDEAKREKVCEIADEVGKNHDIFSIRSFEYSQLDNLEEGKKMQLKKTYRL